MECGSLLAALFSRQLAAAAAKCARLRGGLDCAAQMEFRLRPARLRGTNRYQGLLPDRLGRMLNNDIIYLRASKRAGLLVVLVAAVLGASLSLLAGEFEQGDEQKQPLPARVDFNRDIFPILSNNCFQCPAGQNHAHGRPSWMRPRSPCRPRGACRSCAPKSEKSGLSADHGQRLCRADAARKDRKRLSPRQIGLFKVDPGGCGWGGTGLSCS